MDAPKKRKQIYVDQRVQGGIVARLVFLWLASTALAIVIAALMQYFANPTIGFDQFLAGAGSYFFPLVLAFGVTLPIAILHLLRFTHRFAGPVLRLRNILKELADGGNPPPLKFRDEDYWQDLATEFNRVAQELAASRARSSDFKTDTPLTTDCSPDAAEALEPVGSVQ